MSMVATKDSKHSGPAPEGEEDPSAERFFSTAGAEAKAWWDAQKRYITLRAFEKLGHAAGALLVVVLVAVAASMFLVFASLALAVWLGALMNNLALGFLAVGGIYLVFFLVMQFAMGRWLRQLITLKIINLLYHEEE